MSLQHLRRLVERIVTMKTILISLLTLIVSFALGTFYGWRTGYVDGGVQGQIVTLGVIKKYGALRSSTDTIERDRLIDLLVLHSGNIFANGHSYSPLFAFIHPKADAALLDIAICWELNSREPATWKNGKILPLFPDHSPEANRLEQLKQQMRAYYDRELEKQQKQRQMPPTTGN
jgi:hypothetical protein